MCESYSERETKYSSEVDGDRELGGREGEEGVNRDNKYILICSFSFVFEAQCLTYKSRLASNS